MLAIAGPVSANSGPANNALKRQDYRLAEISGRLMTANAALCRTQMPLPGIDLQSRDQYATAPPESLFDQGPVVIALVLPGSTAERGGLHAGDAVEALGGTHVSDLPTTKGAPQRDAVFDLLARQDAGQPLMMTVRRNGALLDVALPASPGCRALAEIRDGNGMGARSDGRTIQVDFMLAGAADDGGLAVIVAHELAHTVLEHRRRLEALGVAKGFFGEFGRNQQLNRQMEIEADRLSVHLLANAGLDPSAAPAFWRSPLGRRINGGAFHSKVYPSAEGRAQGLEREIADYLGRNGPSWPGHLLSRRSAAP